MSDSFTIGQVETVVETGYFGIRDTVDQEKFHKKVQERIDDGWMLHGPLITDIIRSKLSGDVHLYWHQPMVKPRKRQTYTFYDARTVRNGNGKVYSTIAQIKAEARRKFDMEPEPRYFSDKTRATSQNCVCFGADMDPHGPFVTTPPAEAAEAVPGEQLDEEKLVVPGTKQTYVFYEKAKAGNETEILRVEANYPWEAWAQLITIVQPVLLQDKLGGKDVYFKII